ncbi:hypothetical protein GCK32_016706, partial [Trichostrongylus colubriformis]
MRKQVRMPLLFLQHQPLLWHPLYLLLLQLLLYKLFLIHSCRESLHCKYQECQLCLLLYLHLCSCLKVFGHLQDFQCLCRTSSYRINSDNNPQSSLQRLKVPRKFTIRKSLQAMQPQIKLPRLPSHLPWRLILRPWRRKMNIHHRPSPDQKMLDLPSLRNTFE